MNKIYKVGMLVLMMLVSLALAAPPHQHGTLLVTSNPSNADIYIDGNLYGHHTPELIVLDTGSHVIKLTKEGYDDYTKTVNIRHNRITSMHAILVETVTPPDPDPDPEPVVEVVSEPVVKKVASSGDGSSFYLAQNKSMFGLKSEYKGYGFGVVFGRFLYRDMKINLHQTNLRSFTVSAKGNLNNLNAIHYKLVPTKQYANYKSIESYEVLSTLTKEQLNFYEFVYRTKNNVAPTVIIESADGVVMYDSTPIIREGYSEYYFKVKTGEVGLITFAYK